MTDDATPLGGMPGVEVPPNLRCLGSGRFASGPCERGDSNVRADENASETRRRGECNARPRRRWVPRRGAHMKVRTLLRALSLLSLPMFVALATPTTAHALDCGDRLVALGDPSVFVRSVCGEPTAITTTFGYSPMMPTGYGYGTMRMANIEIWIYDFGPSRFMEELTFVNGILQADHTRGMGTPAGAAAREALRHTERHARHRDD